MTDRELLQQALDALEDVSDDAEEPHKTKEAIEALRTRLAQPELATCKCCNGTGWVIRDADIGTDTECFVCDGKGLIAQPEQNVSYAGNGAASKENTTTPTGFFFQMQRPKPEECYSCGSIHSAYVRHCAKCGYMKGLENPEWTNKGKLRNVTIVFKDVPSYTINRWSKEFDVYLDGKKADIYTTPLKKEWVGLTEKEIERMALTDTFWFINKSGMEAFEWGAFAKAIEAKLKEKNGMD